MPRPTGAAIDLGSTSVHLLVARPERSGLVVLNDESAFLGLGDVRLAQGDIAGVCDASPNATPVMCA